MSSDWRCFSATCEGGTRMPGSATHCSNPKCKLARAISGFDVKEKKRGYAQVAGHVKSLPTPGKRKLGSTKQYKASHIASLYDPEESKPADAPKAAKPKAEPKSTAAPPAPKAATPPKPSPKPAAKASSKPAAAKPEPKPAAAKPAAAKPAAAKPAAGEWICTSGICGGKTTNPGSATVCLNVECQMPFSICGLVAGGTGRSSRRSS